MSEKVNLPKHQNPSADHKATAPYNFIPLPEVIVPAVSRLEDLPDHDVFDENLKSGYLKVSLETKSPLYVRGMLTSQEFEDQEVNYRDGKKLPDSVKDWEYKREAKNKPDFFQTNVVDGARSVKIPGSSLRGMLRNMIEIISYAKVSDSVKEKLPYRVSIRENLGYLEKNTQGEYQIRLALAWELTEKRRHLDVNFKMMMDALGTKPDYKSVTPVFVKIGTRDKQGGREYHIIEKISKTDFDNAVQVNLISKTRKQRKGAPPRVDYCIVAMSDNEATPISIPKKFFGKIKDSGKYGRQLKINEPIFYYIGPGGEVLDVRNLALNQFQIKRLAGRRYRNSPQGLIDSRLTNTDLIDFIDTMFGYVRQSKKGKQGSKQRGYMGKVRVSEANLLGDPENAIFEEPVTPKVLGSPSPESYRLYLTQQNPDDTYNLQDYDESLPDVTLRGYKRYWHQGNVSLKDFTTVPKKETSRIHTYIRPLKSDQAFEFRIDFDNLTSEEVGALCWVLAPLGDPGQVYCHSLGMGKPYGLGAVKLQVEDLVITNRQARYTALFKEDQPVFEDGQLSEKGKMNDYKRAFEKHILTALGREDGKQLQDQERIAMLLAMMTWEGPDDKSLTEYGNVLEDFNERKVLPDPLNID